jgi:hypothetical protein
MGCHRHLSSNPTEFDAWVKTQMAEWVYDDVVSQANSVRKYYKADLEEMLEHYKAQLEYMERRRANGETGYLEFVGYD